MPLTNSQRQHVERRLQEERARALRALNATVAERSEEDEQDRAGDLSSWPLHQADLGTDTMQAELDASNATRVSRELAEIDAALERLIGADGMGSLFKVLALTSPDAPQPAGL